MRMRIDEATKRHLCPSIHVVNRLSQDFSKYLLMNGQRAPSYEEYLDFNQFTKGSASYFQDLLSISRPTRTRGAQVQAVHGRREVLSRRFDAERGSGVHPVPRNGCKRVETLLLKVREVVGWGVPVVKMRLRALGPALLAAEKSEKPSDEKEKAAQSLGAMIFERFAEGLSEIHEL